MTTDPRQLPRAAFALCAAVALLGLLLLAAAARAASSFTKYSLGGHDYWVYQPSGYTGTTPVPLVVYLHGCTELVPNVAIGTRWNQQAEQNTFIVLYPQQSAAANSLMCWNWTNSANWTRGQGEAGLIATMTQQVLAGWNIDHHRVYILGASAGAAMTSIMAATYPDVYAAAGAFAGCAYAGCSDTTGAQSYAAMGSHARPVPALIGGGTADPTYPGVEDTVNQWIGMDDRADDGQANGSVSSVPAATSNYPGTTSSYPYTVNHYNDRNGHDLIDFYTVYGAHHAYLGGDTSEPNTDAMGPAITPAAYAFFMAHPMP